jgi:hypothetical protein
MVGYLDGQWFYMDNCDKKKDWGSAGVGNYIGNLLTWNNQFVGECYAIAHEARAGTCSGYQGTNYVSLVRCNTWKTSCIVSLKAGRAKGASKDGTEDKCQVLLWFHQLYRSIERWCVTRQYIQQEDIYSLTSIESINEPTTSSIPSSDFCNCTCLVYPPKTQSSTIQAENEAFKLSKLKVRQGASWIHSRQMI